MFTHFLFLLFHQMAEEISKPLSQTKKITMVSSGGSEVGAAKLAGEVLEIMNRLPATIEKLTGVNIALVRTPSTLGYGCESDLQVA